ncbi:MAG: O-antigen ligase family protein, partial [Gemmataceae bacterium]
MELAALVGVILLFVAGGWAAYRRAALFGCWEWAGLLALVFLTRQLATTEREKHGLYAVLLSVGVALSAQGLYQRVWKLPRDQAQAVEAKDGPHAWVARHFDQTLESVNDGERELLTRRVMNTNPHASFLYPASLAAVLALLVPGLIAAPVIAVRGEAESWQIAFAGLCALAASLALLATGAWLACLAALFTTAVVLGRGRAVGWAGAVLLTAAVAAALYATGSLDDTLKQRGEAWATSWKLIQNGRVWTGVGPAQFGFYYPAHMRETDGAPAIDANSAPLDLWAAGG